MDRLDYREDINLCLISSEDTIGLRARKQCIIIDIRLPFTAYQDCHLKGSYHMCVNEDTYFETYAEFLGLYHENYPDNLVMFIGDKSDSGHDFAMRLLSSPFTIGRIALIRGGIDAIILECQHLGEPLLRKSKKSTITEFLSQYEKFIKKARQVTR